jgi:hypothetical protein
MKSLLLMALHFADGHKQGRSQSFLFTTITTLMVRVGPHTYYTFAFRYCKYNIYGSKSRYELEHQYDRGTEIILAADMRSM